MRSLVALAAVTGALLGVACTNDYDALLEGASGGGSPASTADASSSTGDASSSSASANGSTTTADASSASSSSGGDGGGGNGGDGSGGHGGGDGGAGEGGTDLLPGATPCDLRLDLTDESPSGWADSTDGASVEIGGGMMKVVFDGDESFEFGLLRHDLDDDELRDCSLTTSVIELPSIPEGVRVNGSLIAMDGSRILAALDVTAARPDAAPAVLQYAMLADLGDGLATVGAATAFDEDQPTFVRMREADAALFFDIHLDGAWLEVGKVDQVDLDGVIDRVGFGGSIGGEAEGGTTVALGPINVDQP